MRKKAKQKERMTCENFMASALESQGCFSPAEKDHLAGCQACRDYVKTLALLEPWGKQPKPETDNAIKFQVKQELFRGHRRLVLRKIASAAAVLILLLGIALNYNISTTPQNAPTEVARRTEPPVYEAEITVDNNDDTNSDTSMPVDELLCSWTTFDVEFSCMKSEMLVLASDF